MHAARLTRPHSKQHTAQHSSTACAVPNLHEQASTAQHTQFCTLAHGQLAHAHSAAAQHSLKRVFQVQHSTLSSAPLPTEFRYCPESGNVYDMSHVAFQDRNRRSQTSSKSSFGDRCLISCKIHAPSFQPHGNIFFYTLLSTLFYTFRLQRLRLTRRRVNAVSFTTIVVPFFHNTFTQWKRA